MGVSVVVFYLPTFIARLFGTAPGPTVGFVVAIPWLCALAATYAVPKLAERTGRLVPFGFASLLVAVAALYMSSGSSQLLSIVATCLAVAGLWAVQPIFWTLLTDYLAGVAAVSGIAFVNCLANIGNFISPNVKAWADVCFGYGVAGLVLFSGVVMLCAMLFLGLRNPSRQGVASKACVNHHAAT
jgi:MFS family permease